MVVDASVWVSQLVQQDAHHQASRHWLHRHVERGGLVVAPVLALGEVAGAIARRTGDPTLGSRAVEQVLRVPGLRLVPIDRQLGQETADLAAELKLRGVDAVYVAIADRLGVALVTWDREQLERAGDRIAVITPVAGPWTVR